MAICHVELKWSLSSHLETSGIKVIYYIAFYTHVPACNQTYMCRPTDRHVIFANSANSVHLLTAGFIVRCIHIQLKITSTHTHTRRHTVHNVLTCRMETKWFSLSEALSLINRTCCGPHTHTKKQTSRSVAIRVNKTHPVLWFHDD